MTSAENDERNAMYTVETNTPTIGGAMTIASEALGRGASFSQAGRLGLEFAGSKDDCQTVAKALRESGYKAVVSKA